MNQSAGITSICYINLDRATSRRATIEENLKQFAGPDVTIRRIRAVDEDYVTRHKIAGSASQREKACLLSHRRAIDRSLDMPGYTLILEDDAQLGSRTMPVLNMLLAAVPGDFDMIFTDLIIATVPSMLKLFRFYREQIRNQRAGIFHAAELDVFAGATAYVLDDRSKRKLLALLDTAHPVNEAYDILLRRLSLTGELLLGYCFPFLTTQSPHAMKSQIQPDCDQILNIVWSDFRKLMFLESDAIKQEGKLPLTVDQLGGDFCDQETLDLLSILKIMLSRRFPANITLY